jgi:hypothetical protein
VLSPAGQAVAVDEAGRVVGTASFDQLRAAIQAETAAEQAAAELRQAEPSP